MFMIFIYFCVNYIDKELDNLYQIPFGLRYSGYTSTTLFCKDAFNNETNQ